MTHINRPSSTRFIVRVRGPYSRRWIQIGLPTKSSSAAIIRLARCMGEDPYRSKGDVIIVADCYDPVVVFEMRRK